MIALGRAYTSVFGAPVIDRIDPRIFTLRYFATCMDCTFCADQCCSYGVDIDTANIDALGALGPDFEAFVGVPASQWFTAERTADAEFPSGTYGRTETRGGKCVFAGAARGCRIHAWCLQLGLDYHRFKPLVSTLFPVTFEYGALVPSPEAVDGTLVCAGTGPTLYEGTRNELLYYFGEAFIAEPDALASTA
jgi:Fe-S-cluster containining protein